MTDLGATTAGRMLDLFDDMRVLRLEFEAFKRASEARIDRLRKAAEASGDEAQALFEEVGKQRDDAVGAHQTLVARALEEEKIKLEELSQHANWGLKGKPGCYSMKWQDKLGAPP